MLRLPPFDKIGVNPPPEFANADPANGQPGSIVNGLVFNILQHEGENLALLAGLTPSGSDLTQWAQAASRGGIWAGSLTGTGDLAVATLGVVIPDLLQGMRVGGIATASNTSTTPKLRVVNKGTQGGYTDYPILKEDGSALAAGDIKAGRRYRFEADGAGNVLISGGGLGGAGAGSLVNIRTFASSGTWTPSAGANRALIFATGAGAGGGGAYGGDSTGGGGAGATAITFLSSLSAQAVTLGLGGTGGTGSSTGSTSNGTAGGTTSVGSVAVAGGGQPTTNAGGGHYGNIGGLGGIATAATLSIPGGFGQTGASYSGSGNPGVGSSGGSSFWGGGGSGSSIGAYLVNPAGQPGQVPGSGGGGSSGSTTNGGNGANGVVLILEFA
jgi:hypothetical protein